MNVDAILIRTAKPKRGPYNCFDFAREVWAEATGEDLGDRVPSAVREYRAAVERNMETRKPLAEPASPCLVVFPARKATPHIGVYWKGRVLHYDLSGPHNEPLDQIEMRLGKGVYLA